MVWKKPKITFAIKTKINIPRFSKSYSENKVKVGPYWEKAQSVQKNADEIVSYIDEIKVEIIAGIEPSVPKENVMGKDENGRDTILNLMNVQVKDNYLFSTALLVGSEPANPKDGQYSARELIGKLEGYRDNLIGKVR